MRKFYVYEHWRPDTDLCFWVGKGHGNRAYDFRRNPHYNKIIAKLARLGLCAEVRIVQGGMRESAAFDLERARIAFWRMAGVPIANHTDGGEGVSGLVHSERTKAILREKRRAQTIIITEETKRKIALSNSIAKKGIKNPAHGDRLRGRKLSPEHRAKISAGAMGRIVSAETRAKIGEAHQGRKHADGARENMRRAHLGKKHSPATRAKMSTAHAQRWENRRRAPCPL